MYVLALSLAVGMLLMLTMKLRELRRKVRECQDIIVHLGGAEWTEDDGFKLYPRYVRSIDEVEKLKRIMDGMRGAV